MLNTERIRLMTRLAAYEQNEGKEDMKVGQYYRRDYVELEMIKTFMSSTIAFCIILVLRILCELQVWKETLYQMDYIEYAKDVLIQYVVFVIIYQVIAGIVYSLRYNKGNKRRKLYHTRLKKVQKLYEREEKLYPVDE